MQIAVVSDTHNSIINLEKAIKEIRSRQIKHLIHCGDLTLSHTLQPCGNLFIYLVFGNGDFDQEAISQELKTLNPESSASITQDFSLYGQRFFVAHGDNHRLIQTALASSTYDWVLQGHTHRFKDELFGRTRWLNPGALGGKSFDDLSFAIIDTVSRSVERVSIKEL